MGEWGESFWARIGTQRWGMHGSPVPNRSLNFADVIRGDKKLRTRIFAVTNRLLDGPETGVNRLRHQQITLEGQASQRIE